MLYMINLILSVCIEQCIPCWSVLRPTAALITVYFSLIVIFDMYTFPLYEI